VADSLVQHRVGHLIVSLDAALDPAVLDPRTEVTVLPADTPELVRAGGAAATLRY
jgi:hypothetical protein